MNLFGERQTSEPAHVERIKAWARATWALADDATVMVTELSCHEPGCPPVETVIALLEAPGRISRHKIHKRAGDVSQADVEALASGGDAHHGH